MLNNTKGKRSLGWGDKMNNGPLKSIYECNESYKECWKEGKSMTPTWFTSVDIAGVETARWKDKIYIGSPSPFSP